MFYCVIARASMLSPVGRARETSRGEALRIAFVSGGARSRDLV